ncbi:type VII secretion protein EccE [Streptomyces sp. NPDC051561]|uniref:type VII secretion protein EccE n=1 Tax=Streptomyces sp. NPDC051561 TaxID=3365658 RepID=UPI003789140A
MPLSLLADVLEVDGVALASAQCVQQVRGDGPAGFPAVRLTWVALRLEPALCPEAVTVRGGGLGGAQRCLVRAASHVASRITGAGLRAEVLDQEGLNSAVSSAACCGSAHVVYTVKGTPDRAAALLTALPGRTATLGLTVRRGPWGASADTTGHLRVSARDASELDLVRGELQQAARAARIGLVRVDGARRSAVLATVPLGGVAR